MPKYNLTSPTTGNSYPVSFDGTPTEQDFQDAIDHFDAPFLAKQRLSEEKQLEEGLGGIPLNPETNQPSYNPEEDLKTVGTFLNAQKIKSLQDQIQNQELDAKSGKLASAVAGAGTIPLGISALVEGLAKKSLGEETFKRAFPRGDVDLQAAFEKLNAVAGANPLSAAAGNTALNAALIASGGALPGGTILNTGRAAGALARGELPAAGQFALTAGRQAIPSAGVNTAIGAGQRELLNEPQTLEAALKDAALGAVLGGDNPEAAANLKEGLQKINPLGPLSERIAQRGILKKPIAAATTEALGITPIEGSADIVPVLKSSILEANGGKIPKDVTPDKLIKNAMDFKINQYEAGLKLAEEKGLAHSTDSLITAMEERVARDHPTYDQSQIDAVVNSVVKENKKLFSSDYISPPEGQNAAVQINRDLNKTNPNRVPKTDAQINAETALSQELSRQGSEMYQAATGTYGTPNQDWGILKQSQEGLTGELKKAQNAEAGKNAGGNYIPSTLTGMVVKTAKKIGGRALVPTRSENVVGSFNRVLNSVEARPSAPEIDPIQQRAIIDQYTPKSPESTTLSLDEKLQKLTPSASKYKGLSDYAKQQIIEQLQSGGRKPTAKELRAFGK